MFNKKIPASIFFKIAEYLKKNDAINLFVSLEITIKREKLINYFGKGYLKLMDGYSTVPDAFFSHYYSIKKILKDLNQENLVNSLMENSHYAYVIFKKLSCDPNFKSIFQQEEKFKDFVQKLVDYPKKFLSEKRKRQICLSEGDEFVSFIENNKRATADKIIHDMLKNRIILALIATNSEESLAALPAAYKECITNACNYFNIVKDDSKYFNPYPLAP